MFVQRGLAYQACTFRVKQQIMYRGVFVAKKLEKNNFVFDSVMTRSLLRDVHKKL